MPIIQARCEYKKAGNCSIGADVYLPTAKRPPVLVYIHGGALISGSRKYLSRHQSNLWVRAGFAVVSIDYRLAPETRLPAIIEDIQDAFAWVRGEGAKLFGFDPERIAVAGGSAGGYLSLMSGTFDQKPKAIVSFYGYGDILGEWYTRSSEFYSRQQPAITKEQAWASVGGREKSTGENSRYTFYFYCRQQGTWPEAVSGYSPETEREKLLLFCPVARIGADYPPTFLLHGDQDTDVPVDQSIQMANALSRHGIQNKLLIIPGGEHGFDGDRKNPLVKEALEKVVDFLKENVN